jgi:hypothetical protein
MSKKAHVIELVIESGVPEGIDLIMSGDPSVSMSFGHHLKISFSLEKSGRRSLYKAEGTIRSSRFSSEAIFKGKLSYKKKALQIRKQ